jgi:hypothetical protein
MVQEKDKQEERTNFEGKKVKILGENFDPGMPTEPHRWRDKLTTREDQLKYLENGERYWFSKEGFGSEKRKTPA